MSSFTTRERAARSSARNVVRLDEYRAKYLELSPRDPFLRDAAVSARILAAAVRLPEVRTDDLRLLLARLCMSLALFGETGARDPCADGLRKEAAVLEGAIALRER